jgi:heme O synthase-like polyprenyltransferase
MNFFLTALPLLPFSSGPRRTRIQILGLYLLALLPLLVILLFVILQLTPLGDAHPAEALLEGP